MSCYSCLSFCSGRQTGLSGSMLRSWKYFTSYEGLQSLFIINNDVTITPGSFLKLHNCAMSEPHTGTVAPVLLLFTGHLIVLYFQYSVFVCLLMLQRVLPTSSSFLGCTLSGRPFSLEVIAATENG